MRCVILDVDGVVVHGFHANPEKRRPWDVALESDLGISRQRLTETFFNGVFASEIVTGRKSLVEALDDVLPGLGYRGSTLDFIAYWLERDSMLDNDLLAAIAAVRKCGARVYLATNQEHIRAFHLWATLGLQARFDDIYYSARLGVTKPQAAFFEAVSTRIGKQRQPPLFFDDSSRNVDAATAHGWEAVVYEGIGDFLDHPWVAGQLAGIPAPAAKE